MSPFTPFLTEAMYQNLRKCLPADAPASVHWCDFPAEEQVGGLQGVSSLGWVHGSWHLAGRRGRCQETECAGSWEVFVVACPAAGLLTSTPAPARPPGPGAQAHAGDARIQASVQRMRSVIELGRTIRERHTKPIKQPLGVSADRGGCGQVLGGVGGGGGGASVARLASLCC